MAKVTKDNVKENMPIWVAVDERPLDNYHYSKGIVTKVFDDHYLYNDIDNNIKDVWGLYEDSDTVCCFTTKEECLDWLKLGK